MTQGAGRTGEKEKKEKEKEEKKKKEKEKSLRADGQTNQRCKRSSQTSKGASPTTPLIMTKLNETG